MTHSIYEELTAMQDHDDYQVKKTTELMGIGHIFDYVWHKYHEAGHFKPIVFYCCYVYSWESKLLRIGADWHKFKLRIAQKVNLPVSLIDDVVNLKDQILYDCFQEFLHLYRENMDFVHVTSLQDMYASIMLSIGRFQADDEGKVNLQERMKNMRNATELKDEIKKQNEEMLDKYRILAAPKSDFEKTEIIDPTQNPVKVEHSKYIR